MNFPFIYIKFPFFVTHTRKHSLYFNSLLRFNLAYTCKGVKSKAPVKADKEYGVKVPRMVMVSDQLWPRVMRRLLVRGRQSVNRGRTGLNRSRDCHGSEPGTRSPSWPLDPISVNNSFKTSGPRYPISASASTSTRCSEPMTLAQISVLTGRMPRKRWLWTRETGSQWSSFLM